ncbi:MAG: 3'-5' exonuclease [Ruminococcaceae bacterium]|nr:3'-5' exonuclease [Oscillospiraceae bacterium]
MINSNSREFKGRSLVGFPQDFCVVDIETTGLRPSDDGIIEIGAIMYENGREADTFSSLLQPKVNAMGDYVSPFITQLTGITNEMLDSAPPAEDVLAEFFDFLGDSIIVGYNVNFDVNFLYDAIYEHLGEYMTNDYIDILRMAKKLYPDMPHHRLGDMTAKFGIINKSAHRALSDVEATYGCFKEFKTEAEIQHGDLNAFINLFPQKARCDNEG